MANGEQVNGVAYWRGTVDSRLESLDDKADENGEKIDKILEKMDQISAEHIQNKGRFVEWEYIRDKFTVPVILGAILFFLFTIAPAALVVIYK